MTRLTTPLQNEDCHGGTEMLLGQQHQEEEEHETSSVFTTTIPSPTKQHQHQHQHQRRRQQLYNYLKNPRRKYHRRAMVLSISFLVVITGYSIHTNFMDIIVNENHRTVVVDGSSMNPTTRHNNNNDDSNHLHRHRRLEEQTSNIFTEDPDQKLNLQEQQDETPPTNNKSKQETKDCSDDDDDDDKKANPPSLAILYFVGILYTFLAIAIVCDELFVPALEEMASDHHLNLSMDVAGATLMAAGGSAPEFFTSLIGTFITEDEVGIGTVVGSAVFNVLFVIACCALFSKELLQLTGWPLARDSIYYAVGLVTLGLFVGMVSPGEIELWEAIVLFCEYIGYVIVMKYNEDLHKYVVGRELGTPAPAPPPTSSSSPTEPCSIDIQDKEEVDNQDGNNNNNIDIDNHNVDDKDIEESTTTRITNMTDGESPELLNITPNDEHPSLLRRGCLQTVDSNRSILSVATNATLPWPGTFRTGVLKLLRDPTSWTATVGVGIVAQIAGDVNHVFRQVDIDGNGEIDKEELGQLFQKLNCQATEEELDQVMADLDKDQDGKVSEEDFTAWYIQSEEKIRKEVKPIFDHFDTDHSGTIDHTKVKLLLTKVEPSVTDDDVKEAMDIMYQHGSRDQITFDEFSDWYTHSLVYDRQKKKAEEELTESIWDSVKPPSLEEDAGGCGICMAYIQYLLVLPIVLVLALTVPDVRIPRLAKYCYLSFCMSIVWIGVFSFFMVGWSEIIGNTIGIPPVIMGLTLLAAGTSVPDLLSSVIVARMGEGDMALSSSIGSNIFDILVGLPVPWIFYTALPSKPNTVTIDSDNVWISIFVLLGMLIFIVFVIHWQKWKLTKTLGAMMFVFYFAFLVQAIILELPFDNCN
mmetsp:Transcript_9798/g.15053  ORF Transcript_9798/g.15053 Transcript_9798/m.15053 type:complete len:866 (-) Transcript_9798:185-2782(-)|eukprot:CAMPEP_0195299698 /NCGR_PEP_ID=MMETSP0707-20130614/26026_1 /TAXON_ID=33640 /ORGANISM="Asterionellopsis glacialis, Strain CCMP134" /LENGTH=865 /DNA_ID=CAMNT_0040362171 /DNA_START=283 /DNA_END=2880 /DNA_ORIENTATION=-